MSARNKKAHVRTTASPNYQRHPAGWRKKSDVLELRWSVSAHHLNELPETDLAVTVDVALLQHLRNRVAWHRGLHVAVVQELHELLLANVAVVVAVKDLEGLPASLLFAVALPVQRGCQELGVVNAPAAVDVNLLHHPLQVIQLLAHAEFVEAILELVEGHGLVAVLIQQRKHVLQAPHIVVMKPLRDGVKGRLLQLTLATEGAHPLLALVQPEVHARGVGALDPGVGQSLLGRATLLGLAA
mmetsp:Transcript_19699/g.60847  ORF Transcript_19699/g.60847 Transcript_19699/m.60847 type:complete len:242 (+) Transcript_19699:13-738(+)